MNSDHQKPELLDEYHFREVLAESYNGSERLGLINEHAEPIECLIHPLTHSLNVRDHPDMVTIPVGYKFTRQLKDLYLELKKA